MSFNLINPSGFVQSMNSATTPVVKTTIAVAVTVALACLATSELTRCANFPLGGV